jgi:STE24 endopeptidase
MRLKSFAVAALALAAIPTAAHAAGFDVEQATRAYLDTLQGPARAKSDAYFEGGYWLIL